MSEPTHLFAFLGTGKYEECYYTQQEHGWRSQAVRYVQVATAQRHQAQVTHVTIFATQDARAKHEAGLLEEFKQHLPELEPHIEVVPEGFDPEQALALFGILSDVLERGPKRLILDITHGFRAQPALALMALNYLSSTNPELEVEDIVYGAFRFDAPKDDEGRASHELVSLIDLWRLNSWAKAFDQFHQTGAVRPLATLAKQTQDAYMRHKAHQLATQKPELNKLSGALFKWQEGIENNALPHLLGPHGIITEVTQNLAAPWNPISERLGRFIQPLKQKMLDRLVPITTSAPLDSAESLEAQLGLIRWLHDHGHYQSVYTLLREWLTTLFQHALQLEDRRLADTMVTATQRGSSEGRLSDEHEALRVGFVQAVEPIFNDSLIKLISPIVERRNSLNHAYHPETLSAAPKGFGDLKKESAKLTARLEALLAATIKLTQPPADAE